MPKNTEMSSCSHFFSPVLKLNLVLLCFLFHVFFFLLKFPFILLLLLYYFFLPLSLHFDISNCLSPSISIHLLNCPFQEAPYLSSLYLEV